MSNEAASYVIRIVPLLFHKDTVVVTRIITQCSIKLVFSCGLYHDFEQEALFVMRSMFLCSIQVIVFHAGCALVSNKSALLFMRITTLFQYDALFSCGSHPYVQ